MIQSQTQLADKQRHEYLRFRQWGGGRGKREAGWREVREQRVVSDADRLRSARVRRNSQENVAKGLLVR